MIILSADAAEARRQLAAIQAMLVAVGQAQADHFGSTVPSFAGAEAAALSIASADGRNLLQTDRQAAEQGRRRAVSWVFRRLFEIVQSPAEIRVATPRQIGALGRAFGGTTPRYRSYVLFDSTRGYIRLPGPVRSVDVSAATVHPLTRDARAALDIGRTLVHELVIHAWREIFFYQAVPGGPAQDGATQAVHRDLPHAPSRRGGHNLADAEADLLDYYYDLARGHDIAFGERHHPGFGRLVQRLGIMGDPITRWEETGGRQARESAAEMAAEQDRFVRELHVFQQQQRLSRMHRMSHMRQIESRVAE